MNVHKNSRFLFREIGTVSVVVSLLSFAIAQASEVRPAAASRTGLEKSIECGAAASAGLTAGAAQSNDCHKEKSIESRWGLKIVSMRRTAADTMLDFRFRILDPDKAREVMDRKTPAFLIDQKSGRKFRVPVTTKLGPLRQRSQRIRPDKNYFMFFANPGRTIRKGDQVTVMIGDFRADNIIVE